MRYVLLVVVALAVVGCRVEPGDVDADADADADTDADADFEPECHNRDDCAYGEICLTGICQTIIPDADAEG